MNNTCFCDEKCFTYYNASDGYRYFKCNKEDNRCDYYRVVKESDVEGYIMVGEKRFTPPPQPSHEEELKHLGDAFVINHLLSRFQEIENISGERYNNDQESVMEYVSRICNIKI